MMALPMLLWIAAEGYRRVRLGGMTPGPEGAAWIHHWSRRLLWVIGIEAAFEGPLPEAQGMLAVVSNHLSYIDILLYSAARPFIMISKTEVRGWPLIGFITSLAGTVYVQRRDAPGGQTETHEQVNTRMAAAFRSGLPVLFFPEGTTTDGTGVLEFRRGLFHSVLRDNVPLRAAAVHYRIGRNGSATVGEDVCFVGDASLAPHLFGLLGLRGVRACVRFGARNVDGDDRFTLACNAHAEVSRLYTALMADANASERAHADLGLPGGVPEDRSAI